MAMLSSTYDDFLASKRLEGRAYGRVVDPSEINPLLFPFQRDLVRWAVRKGRAGIFSDCGTGKTAMQCEFARLTGEPTLILAPLAVAQQTVREAAKFGISVQYARRQDDVAEKIVVTNYQMLDKFDAGKFGTVILDEAGILKDFEGKTRTRLIETFRDTPYRLCATATPAPNDHTEIGNHSEFLGVMPRIEMLAAFFVHDDSGWRLKGHAREAFYRWVASWAMWLRKPSDLGYSDEGFVLPPLEIEPVIVPSDYVPSGQLFPTGLGGIGERAAVRRGTMLDRVTKTAQIVNRDKGHQWIIWCGLNDEGITLYRLIEGATLIEGHQTIEQKEMRLDLFLSGEARVLITKPSMMGHGLNLQNCTRMAFVGLSDSYEQYYQCIRRAWRFGQKEPVRVHVVLSDVEEAIYQNVLRKEEEALAMAEGLIANVAAFERAEVGQSEGASWEYRTGEASGRDWRLLLGDSAERLGELESASVDLSVYSPPFLSLYTYTPSERDLGNSRTPEEFWQHYRFIIDHLFRLTKTGRVTCCHVSQVPAMLVRDGYIGLKDFRGQTIAAYEEAGWIYHGEVTVDRDPQAQAIRTHAKGLAFPQLRKDASWMRPALADYILVFRKPGEAVSPVISDVENDTWIEWARPVWYDVSYRTLNAVEATTSRDERHICALSLDLIERCIRLWSNKGDLVLSPFAGIGSECYQAVKLGRRAVGVELKPEYFGVAVKNLRRAEDETNVVDLFSFAGVDVDSRAGGVT